MSGSTPHIDSLADKDRWRDRKKDPRTEPNNDFGPPLDLFHYAFLDETPRIGLDVFPPIIAAFAADVGERLAVEPEAIAMLTLVNLAGALTDAYEIQPTHDDEWRESARLWGAVLAESGLNKTAMLAAVTKPMQRIDEAWQTEDSQRAAGYRRDHAVWVQAYKTWTKAAAKGQSADEPAEPPKPVRRRLIVQHTTIEALVDIVRDNPRGVLVVHDELSAWFGSFDAYRETKTSKDRPIWMQGFGGGPLHYDRVGRGYIHVPNWSYSIVGVIPPGPMRRIASRLSDDGLVQRFLTVRVRGSAAPKADRSADVNAVIGYSRLVETLTRLKPLEGMRPTTLSREAHSHRMKLDAHIDALKQLPGIKADAAFVAHLNKLPGMYARILLLCHVIESISRDLLQPEAHVSPDLAERTTRLFLHYLIPHGAWFYRHIVAQKAATNDLCIFIASLILTRGMKTISARDIYKAKHLTAEMTPEIEAAMLLLGAFNWVRPFEDQPQWHPNRWIVNWLVHERFTDIATRERKRRAEEAERMRAAGLTLGLEIPQGEDGD